MRSLDIDAEGTERKRSVLIHRGGTYSVGDLLQDFHPEEVIFGSSGGMQVVRQTLQKAALSGSPVLITGETGTGKEVMARLVHLQSPWRDGPFFKVNCPVLQGAAGGDDPLGCAAAAPAQMTGGEAGGGGVSSRGTLFLNEIAFLNQTLQVRLLEKLQESPVFRVGLAEGNGLEFRIVCTTSQNLEREVSAGNFLRELYYLIRVVTVDLPPLRRRREDLPILVNYLLDRYNRRFQKSVPLPPQRILRMMSEYDWPGNIRELENLMMRYVVQGTPEAFQGELGSPRPLPVGGGPSRQEALSLKDMTRETIQEWERKIIRRVLEEHHWNRRQAARALKISYRALLYKIKEAGVPPKRILRNAESSRRGPDATPEPDHPGGEIPS